jgi:hypothetical protein
MEQTKVCRRCGIEKELSEYHKDKNFKDNHKKDCKKCVNLKNNTQKNNIPKYKTCSICGLKKESNQFHFRKASKDGLNPNCKVCRKILSQKDFMLKNIPKTIPWVDGGDMTKICSVCGIEKSFSQFSKKCSSLDGYMSECKTCVAPKKKVYSEKNKIKLSLKRKKYINNRLKTDSFLKLKYNIRRRTLLAIEKGQGKKQGSTIELIGCSWEQVQEHLKSTMYGGMTWDDYLNGKAHVDHIIPISSFDLTTLEGQKKASHYTNLQLLWAEDNLKKGAKLDYKINKKEDI